MSPYNRPPLRWLGGKFKLLPIIARHIPANTRRTIEPFAGGAAFSFNLGRGKAIINDSNPDLINLYRHIRSHRRLLLADLNGLFVPANNTKDAYYALRGEFNSTTDRLRKAALFVYLNKHAWGGVVGYSKSGKFNVSFAAFPKQAPVPEEALSSFGKRCKDYVFTSHDFTKTMREAGPGDCCYLDPPYADSSHGKSFVSYTKDGFKSDMQRKLADCAVEASSRGATVIISNHYTPETRVIYSKADEIDAFSVARLISRNGLVVKECLAIYRPKNRKWRKCNAQS